MQEVIVLVNGEKIIRRVIPLLVLSLALVAAVSLSLLGATNGGENDTVVAVEVRALSDVHNGQFEALMPSGCRKKIDMRRKSSSGYVSGLKAGEKWILVFVEEKELDGTVLYPHFAEKAKSSRQGE